MVEIKFVDVGGSISLDAKESVKAIRQINDLFNIANINTSYTSSFTIEKTPENIVLLQGAGLIGNTSKVAYQKTIVDMTFRGFTIVRRGQFVLLEAGDKFSATILDGIVDFFKLIENRTIGVNLDLSDINHNKDLQTVINSQNGTLPFMYIFSDFGGNNWVSNGVMNIDYQVPSVKLKYFLDKIFKYVGYTYSGDLLLNNNFLDSYITFPKGPQKQNSIIVNSASFRKDPFNNNKPVYVSGDNYPSWPSAYSWNFANTQEGQLLDNWSYRVGVSGGYLISASVLGQASRGTLSNAVNFIVTSNGREIFSILSNPDGMTVVSGEISGMLTAGDIVSFKIINTTARDAVLYSDGFSFKIQRIATEVVSFTEAFKEFSFKDYVKEIVNRFGLTPVVDIDKKNIEFIDTSKRLDKRTAVDWSSNFVKLTSEKYQADTYARKNIFAHKYNDGQEQNKNGNLIIQNQNLIDEKTLYQSPIYAAGNIQVMAVLDLQGSSQYFQTSQYFIWQAETKEVIDNNETKIEVSYKSLSDRFFIIKPLSFPHQTRIGSAELGGSPVVISNMKVADGTMTHFSDLVPVYLQSYTDVLNNFVCAQISLNLTYIDLINLNLTKLYYFEQLASYYMLNKLTWDSESKVTGEFVKVH